jgi:hypothetical protein
VRVADEVESGSNAGEPGQVLRSVKEMARIEPRQAVDTTAVIRLIDIAANLEGRLLDISLGGCHIRTAKRFPVGIFRRVETGFRIAGLSFWLGGVTQALYDPFNVGIRFLDMSERKREQLTQLIAEIREMLEREKAQAALTASAKEDKAAIKENS